jgi:drug/metabolite transporter (DMT)-like permease
MGASEWAMLITLSLLWGASFFFNGVAVQSLPTFTVVVARVVIAAVILHLALRASGLRMPRDAALWRTFFAMALINNAMPFSLIVWGQSHIASGLAAIVNATTPLFTVMIAHVFTSDEKLTRGRLAGVIIGLSGVAVKS